MNNKKVHYLNSIFVNAIEIFTINLQASTNFFRSCSQEFKGEFYRFPLTDRSLANIICGMEVASDDCHLRGLLRQCFFEVLL